SLWVALWSPAKSACRVPRRAARPCELCVSGSLVVAYPSCVSSLELLFLCGLFFFRGAFLGAGFFRRRVFAGGFLAGGFLAAALFGILRARVLATALFTLRRGLAFFGSAIRRFSRVIRNVPPRPLKLNRRCRDHGFHFPTAVGALFQMRAGHRLDFLRVAPTLQAFVFIQWHSNSLRSLSKRKSITRVTKCLR